MTTERKMATLRRVAEIRPIEGANKIEHVRVDGWWVVCKKDEYKVGDLVVYCEIDSWIPNEIAPFLTKEGKGPKVYQNIPGEKLRTVRLRKALSQGLILPLSVLEGRDISPSLGIQKWELPVPSNLHGLVRSNFPSWMPRTDQERCQNIPILFDDLDSKYEISLKLDGSSISIACNKGDIHVCSRNLDLKLDDDNSFVRTAKESGIIEVLSSYYDATGKSLAVQGELLGPGIQGNREKLTEYNIFVFDIWDIDNQQYLTPEQRLDFSQTYSLNHVPSVSNLSLRDIGSTTLDTLLAYATHNWEGFTSPIEGLVFKREDGKFSFKVINNEFLEHQR